MLDALNAAAAPPPTIRREDYRPPDWLVPEISLQFELGADRTLVRAYSTSSATAIMASRCGSTARAWS
jgi:aminopeptidase N